MSQSLPSPDAARTPDSAERRVAIRNALAPSLIAEPLRSQVENGAPDVLRQVIIELNIDFPGGRIGARDSVVEHLREKLGADRAAVALRRNMPDVLHPYVFAELTRDELYDLLARDGETATKLSEDQDKREQDAAPTEAPATPVAGASTAKPLPAAPHRALRAIFKVWESAEIRPLTTVSVRTVKADAAQTAYAAFGEKIVWAVLDSGVDQSHPHFDTYKNVVLDPPLVHRSFLAETDAVSQDPLQDPFGHGTHCAGIIAGCENPAKPAIAAQQSVSADGTSGECHLHEVTGIHGMAPKCKVLSLKVLRADGGGDVIAAINALEYVMQINGWGEHILVHGVNISAGYLPDPRYYGIGSTPLCRQVDRAVRSGVVVVVAAGNSGYVQTSVVGSDLIAGLSFQSAQLASINDPGNARLALTVGATHREEPHTYGVSFFSSKGPTADGRPKPDVVAPGERIISCAAGTAKQLISEQLTEAVAGTAPEFDYIEDTGTSMAAPHVSGIVAAFLSIRREFIGQAESVRKLVRRSAMDLRRDRRMQGAGLVDLMRLIESV